MHDKESRISTLQSFRENSFRERGPTVAVALQAENRPSTTVGVHHNQAQAFLKVKLLETPVPRSKCRNMLSRVDATHGSLVAVGIADSLQPRSDGHQSSVVDADGRDQPALVPAWSSLKPR